ncbi:MAG: MOSC domain-containing protein [Alphaproteobacteria bacterium]
MKLISVNVAKPRQVTHLGRTYMTAIFKQPVAGRVMLRTLNLDGDGQGNTELHGGPYMAAYVYAIENYAHWERELGRSDLGYGQFGENFTVEGMIENDIHIGDVFRIGGAVVEVTEPRAPCHKLAMRMGSEKFPLMFLASGRVGFYLRVIEEGVLGAGDTIELISADRHAMSVREISRLWAAKTPDPARLRNAIEIPALAPEWRQHFEKKLAKSV